MRRGLFTTRCTGPGKTPNVCCTHTPLMPPRSAPAKDGMLDTRSQAAAGFHDDVAYFDLYDGILRAEEEGDRMAQVLGDKRVLIMRNHGVVIAGASVGHAYLSLYLLERACQFQLLATGESNHELNQIPRTSRPISVAKPASPVPVTDTFKE